MSNHNQHAGNGNGGFEHEDLGARTIFGVLIGLAVLGIVVYFIVNGMYGALNRYDVSHQAAQNPMKPPAEIDTRDLNAAKVSARIDKTFPEPRLETDERNELTDFRLREEEELNSYGWIDQKAGIVHIPIERAMQLIVERGLPVRPSETKSGSSNKMAQSGKTAAPSSKE